MGTLSEMMARQRSQVEVKDGSNPEVAGIGAESMAPIPAETQSAEAPAKPRLGFLVGRSAGKPAASSPVNPKATPNAGKPVVPAESRTVPVKDIPPGSPEVSSGGGGLARLAQLGAGNAVAGEQNGGAGSITATADSGVFSLADLENTEEVGTQEPRISYSDEIPATAPTRELPEDMTESMNGFVMMLNGIYQAIYDPEGFGQMVRSIMQELQENPEYKRLIADEDVHTLMRGLRESMGMAKVVKQAKERKPGSGAKGKAPSARTASVLDTIDDMGFEEGAFD